ncbi:MAG: biotin transporter BioY [Candidatus Hydrogenedentes bacterium]|nr:biotin transporter BioY [Candidatus Hydrogenedentota bacterium]
METEQSFTRVRLDRENCPGSVEIVAVAGAIALGSWVKIYLPFSPVPFTLQTFAVLVAALALSRRRATAGILLYAALGLAGAPLFAGVAFGPTFGYIAGFALAPFVVNGTRKPLVSIIAATAIIYVCGISWLMSWGHLPLSKAIAVGVVPFIAGDALKAVAAYGVARWLRRSEPEA